MTRQDSVELFVLLGAAYPREPITEAQIGLYEAFLAPYAFDTVRNAVLRHIAQSPWFPRISDLLALIAEPDTVSADQAWAEVQRQIRSVGVYGTPQWSHPAIAAAVTALGWEAVCRSTNPEADRAHFLRFFDTAVRRQRLAQWHEVPARIQEALRGFGTPGANVPGAGLPAGDLPGREREDTA